MNDTPKGVNFKLVHISELHSILAVANLLAHVNLFTVMLLWASKFGAAKIECSVEMGK